MGKTSIITFVLLAAAMSMLDAQPVGKEQLTGYWRIISITTDGKTQDPEYYNAAMEFKADGTWIQYMGKSEDTGVFRVDTAKKILMIKQDDGNEWESMLYEIKETGQLVLRDPESPEKNWALLEKSE
jgi:uncharacterized protein (TIGR03067 family)